MVLPLSHYVLPMKIEKVLQNCCKTQFSSITRHLDIIDYYLNVSDNDYKLLSITVMS